MPARSSDRAERAELLAAPRVPAQLVPRARQRRRLDRFAALTIVEALAGFGKTSLAAGWASELERDGTRVVWCRAAAEVDDAASFLDLLHHGLVRSGALLQPISEPWDRHSTTGLPGWAQSLAWSESPVAVVIDDAQLLRDPAVADVLVRLAQVAHPLHLLALTDTDHHFHAAAARHGLETNALHGSDLAVTADELPAFAQAWGHELSMESAQRLHGLVGGWLLPLRLVLDATPSWSKEFATHVAHDFLINRVLPSFADSPDLTAAMRLAVPERLDHEVATLLLGDADGSSPAVLAELATGSLERQGLLWRVPRHDRTLQWRFPRLVRRVLLERFEQGEPDAASMAHRHVARWLAATARDWRFGELVRHLRSAEDWPQLAQLWRDHGWALLGGEPEAFEFSYAAISPGVLQAHPALVLPAALGDALAATADDGDWMHRAEVLLSQYADTGSDLLRAPGGPRDPAQVVELLTAAMIGRRHAGDLAEAGRLAARAIEELDRAQHAGPTRRRTSQVGWFHLQIAITQLANAECGSAHEQAVIAHQAASRTLVGARAAGLLSAMHAVSGHGVDARQWLARHESTDLTGRWAAGVAELPARLARAMLAMDRLDAQSADAELSRVPLGAESGGLWPLVVLAHHRYALLFGDPVAMLSRLELVGQVLRRQTRERGTAGARVLERCTVDLLLAAGQASRVQPRLREHASRPWLAASAALFHLVTGSADDAAQIATNGVWRDDVSVRDRADMLVIASLALRELGQTDRASETFVRAHALSMDTGNLQPFLLMPAGPRRQLLAATGLELPPEDAARLDAVGSIYPGRVELVRLSAREMEVLREIRHHDTASSLAKALSVSVNTIKKQLGSLYAKLGVHDRSSALLRAHGLGLLDDPEGSPSDMRG